MVMAESHDLYQPASYLLQFGGMLSDASVEPLAKPIVAKLASVATYDFQPRDLENAHARPRA